MKPEDCAFRMAAVGPLFPEQENFEDHRIVRDKMATLEHEVAEALRSRGLHVLGVHSHSGTVGTDLVEYVIQELWHALANGDA